MATTTPSSRLDHLKICMDCSGEGTRHVTDSGKGSLPIRRTVTCARCDGEGLIYVGPEDRRPFVEALSRAALVAAAQRRRLVGRGKHGASGSTARISMRYHDLSYDAAHLTEAVLEEALDEPAAGRVVVAAPARVRPRRSAKAARQSDV